MYTRDELKPISCDDWPELRDMFKHEWPKHEIAYNTIQNYINWVTTDPKIRQLRVFGLNDSWRENGTYIIVDRYQMFLHSLEESNDSLKRALQLIDWDYSYMICSAPDSSRSVLKDVFKSLNVDFLWEATSIKYELLKEDCLKLEIALPEGLYLKKLELKHASIANELWPYSCEGSEFFLKRMAAWNTSIGLFNESGEMLAWSFCWPTGAIGPLEVAKNHLRKGYGSLIAKAIAKEVAKVGLNCYGTVVSTNTVSKAMFDKLGFVPVEDTYYVRTRARKLVEYDN
ncbi:uncharacterized protein LOC135702983 [Ochlerotatus camptorhynchus]|uniref:uncharacterized protein LOC135702983 n=1 Tax=Ochlerotatus camptorhynchus TaxID=644619 RepID=UPI0031D44E8F